VVGATGEFCEVDVDECESNRSCYAFGTSTCVDLGIDTYECTCLPGNSGEFCQVSATTTYVVNVALDSSEDVEAYREQLELDLLDEFTDIEVSVSILAHYDGTDVVSFQLILFSFDDEVNFEQTELEDLLVEAGYEGQLIYSESQPDTTVASLFSPSTEGLFVLLASCLLAAQN
jgi:hypothetical protein